MSLAADPTDHLSQYAHPEALVTAEWLAEHLGEPDLVVLEADEDLLLYDTGHIPTAWRLDWRTDLCQPMVRDYVDGAAFAALCTERGITRDSTVVVYGDRSNWWAAYVLWVFTLFGHPDLRLLDGGRQRWLDIDAPLTCDPPQRADDTEPYPVVERDDEHARAFRGEILAALGGPAPAMPALVDVRSAVEYSGERTAPPGYPEESALRGGHISTAVNIPWERAVRPDGAFQPREALTLVYRDEMRLDPDRETIVYCRIGERSSHTWFTLTHLLGFTRVRNYDGSWTEWGSGVRMPIVRGSAPGAPGTLGLSG